MTQAEAYARFRALHDTTFVMPNPWDGASAVLMAQAGFQALGTTSAGIAFALGRQDGAHAVGLAEAVANGTLMARLTGLPVNGDLEDGFGPDPEHCAETVRAAIAGGLAGLGIEDTTADPALPIHGFDAAVAACALPPPPRAGASCSQAGPTISSTAVPTSTTPSAASSPSPRWGRTCSTPPACPTWTPSAPWSAPSRRSRSTC
jgi:hypothetical protein